MNIEREVSIQFNAKQKKWLNDQGKSTQAVIKQLVNEAMKSQETKNEQSKRDKK